MPLSAGMIREILTVDKMGNGQVKGNQQKVGESKSQLCRPQASRTREGIDDQIGAEGVRGAAQGSGPGQGEAVPSEARGGSEGTHTAMPSPSLPFPAGTFLCQNPTGTSWKHRDLLCSPYRSASGMQSWPEHSESGGFWRGQWNV